MKAKPYIFILLSILLGFVIGYLTNAQINRHKIEKMVQLGMEEGFTHHIINLLHPDEEQMKKLEPIIEKYARLNAEIARTFGMEFKNQMSAFYEEMEPYLTEEQKARWEHFEKMRKKGWQRHRHGIKNPKAFGPPPYAGRFNRKEFALLKSLPLDSFQRLQIDSIMRKYQTEVDSIKQLYLNIQAYKVALREAQMEKNNGIRKILDESNLPDSIKYNLPYYRFK